MKKAQAWGFDLVVGMIIFVVGILSFYLYTTNLPGASEETIQHLQQDGELVADSLMSEGSPEDWTVSTVVMIGILSDDRINQTKLDSFRSLASSDYNLTRSLFRVRNNYFVYLDGDFASGIGADSTDAVNLVKVTRAVVYDRSVTTLNVYAWN
ncbi:MAG: hypothetical protein ABIH92_01530 [Nanoarchaeota archaeon]